MPAPPASASKATWASTCCCSSRRCTSSPTSTRRLQLKRGSHNLFKVSLDGELEGPRPLRVSGKATFEILWCDFSVRFDKTLVDGERPPLPPAVDVLRAAHPGARVAVELEHAAQRHADARRRVAEPAAGRPRRTDGARSAGAAAWSSSRSCRSTPSATSTPSAARRWPGPAASRSPPRSTARRCSSAAQRAPFAPAQFFAMSDDEKLAAPSFEAMDAGMRVRRCDSRASIAAQVIAGAAGVRARSASRCKARRRAPPAAPRPPPYTMSAAQLQTFTRSGAAAARPGATRRPGALPQ